MPKIDEDKFVEIDKKWGRGIAVDLYNDEYFLVSARRNKEGDIWADWGYPQRFIDGKKQASEKGIPWKMTLGVKQQAIQYLEQLIMMIEGRTKPDDGDAPF